jgi:hypothetical protein
MGWLVEGDINGLVKLGTVLGKDCRIVLWDVR